jgi:hypothetical protein
MSWNNCDSISEWCLQNHYETVATTFSEQTTGTIYSISVSTTINGGDITSIVPAGITGSIDYPDANCSAIFIVDVSGSIFIHATPKSGSIFTRWGTNQCDSESRFNGICTMNQINGSPLTTTRRADAFFLVE